MIVIVALDKFKGSLTTFEANEIVEKGIKEYFPSASVLCFPMADGGDGFSDVMRHYLQTKMVFVPTVNALQQPILSHYEWDNKNYIAIIEVAKASGMQQLAKQNRNPLYTNTYGTGLLIKHAINNGAKKIILGLGGSATNDGGIGILAALGYKFLDKDGNLLVPIGKHLRAIKQINQSKLYAPNIEIELACDVDNILFGNQGAAYMYAGQKGASENDIKVLDEGLRNLSSVLSKYCGADFSATQGCGAAGGIPLGIQSFFNAKIVKGINLIINHSGILHYASKADLFITGEGKIDNQSLHGKVISSIANIANSNGKSCIAYCGINTVNESFQKQFNNIFAIKNDTISEQYSIDNASNLLLELVEKTIKNIKR